LNTNTSTYGLSLDDFALTKSTCDSRCGDGIVTLDEACDDGVNDGSYGGCNPDCSRAPRVPAREAELAATHCAKGGMPLKCWSDRFPSGPRGFLHWGAEPRTRTVSSINERGAVDGSGIEGR
jgi:cysteine-rich repeat protein